MSIQTIQNECLSVSVKNMGAELCKVTNKKNNHDYLWGGNPLYWNRHSPILFPFIGKLKNDQTTIKNNLYKMGQHGIARDLEHSLVNQSDQQLDFLLESSAETKKKYPWDFQLLSSYKLNGHFLEQTFTVTNTDAEKIYFSLGFHPAFPWPLDPKTAKEDWEIEFSEKESQDKWNFENGLITETKSPFLKDQKSFKLKDDLFINDVLIFERLNSSKITLRSDKSPMKLIVHANAYPFTGIWTKPGNPFVCIEPWHGIADSWANDRVFEEKIGIQSLNAGEKFVTKMNFEIV